MKTQNSLTQRLQQFMDRKSGTISAKSPAVDALFLEIWPELYRVAARELGRKDRHFAPLTRTELISELWVQHLAKGSEQVITDRHHFFAIAARVMRHVLIDCARRRLTQIRGGGESHLSLDESDVAMTASVNDDRQAVEIGILMERLEVKNPRVAEVVDLHYFCGYTFEEVADKAGLSEKQARTAWAEGKKLLTRALRAARKRDEKAAQSDPAPRSSTIGAANTPAAEGLLPGSNS